VADLARRTRVSSRHSSKTIPVDPPAAAAAPAPKSDDAVITRKQVDDQSELILTPEDLKRVKFRTKVDGTESMVDGTKVLATFQKNEAADVRLAQATEMMRKAEAAQQAAEQKLKEAQTKAEAEAAAKVLKEAEAAKAGLSDTLKQAQTLLFEGRTEESVELWLKALDTVGTIAASKSRGPEPAKLDEQEVVRRVAPVVQQQLDANRALTQLYKDYPQLQQDQDFATIADSHRARLEREGKPRHEAIAEAGDIVATKFGWNKATATSSADDQGGKKGSTTLAERAAAKKGLDEPRAASARASDATTQQPKTRSATIAEIARARGQQY
jgi:hypothetical protein